MDWHRKVNPVNVRVQMLQLARDGLHLDGVRAPIGRAVAIHVVSQ
jgi:hypothetical protein